MVGVIPAAGHGTRAYPYTRGVPKAMLEVAGEPNLEDVIRIMRDQLRIREIVIVIGAYGDMITRYFGDGSRFGVNIQYVENDAVELGLSYSILLARPHVNDVFCVMLGDERYVGSNHEILLETDSRDRLATCAVMRTKEIERIEKNYGVWIDAGGGIQRLVEKPHAPEGALLGVGTFLFHPDVFDHLEAALSAPADGADPVSVLEHLRGAGHAIAACELDGLYVNINDRDDLNLAANLVRRVSFEERSVGLVLLEKGTVDDTRRTIEEFRAVERFVEIILVTAPESAIEEELPVRRVEAASPEYGDMQRAGFDAATTDIIVTAQSDGSASPQDVPKFLEYLKDADLVVGTRTTRQLIQQGTNMRGVVRLAHVLLAKLLELVWWSYEPRFTDLGCAYRAIWSSTYRLVAPCLDSRGPEYAIELLLETLRCRKQLIEIPVNFRIRRPNLKEKDQTLRTFWRIVSIIIQRRLASLRQ
jgi:NDP-sugar pyrophosphorylase family protein